ncbi:hypothetical protein Tco_0559207 [Tanacetum coccineum]
MPPRRNNRRNETPEVDPAFAAAVQHAVRALLHELTAEITAGMNNANNANNENNANLRNGRRDGNGNGGNGRDAQATDIYVWLERFQKKKPLTFSSTPTPVEAENWIAHIEKIFEYFLRSEQEKYEREYKSIRQRDARDKLVNMEFSDVAEAANAARNIEILQKEMLASTPNDNKKRTRENEQDENETHSGKQG